MMRNIEQVCEGCAQGLVAAVLDENGTKSSVSGLPGTWCHAVEDAGWWPCTHPCVAEVESLRAEIADRAALEASLRAEVERLRAERDALLAEVESLRAEVEALRAEVERLREQILEPILTPSMREILRMTASDGCK